MWSLRAQRLKEWMSEVLFSNSMLSDIWCGFSWLEEGIIALKYMTQLPLWWKDNYFAALAKKTGWHGDTRICIFGAEWVSAAVVEPHGPAPVWKAFPPCSASCLAQAVLALGNSVFTEVNPRTETTCLLFCLRSHAIIDMTSYIHLIVDLVNLDYIFLISVTQWFPPLVPLEHWPWNCPRPSEILTFSHWIDKQLAEVIQGPAWLLGRRLDLEKAADVGFAICLTTCVMGSTVRPHHSVLSPYSFPWDKSSVVRVWFV